MHSKIEIVDILIADKLGRSTIYKELERRTHETWTCTNEYDKRLSGKSWEKPKILWLGESLWLGLFPGNTTDAVFSTIWKTMCRRLLHRYRWYCHTEIFEWEMRVQAMQNQVFIAMCNRVGTEGEMEFAGESLVIAPNGNVIIKADDTEQLLICDIDFQEVKTARKKQDYLSLRRPEQYIG